jgi:hypothetical protein
MTRTLDKTIFILAYWPMLLWLMAIPHESARQFWANVSMAFNEHMPGFRSPRLCKIRMAIWLMGVSGCVATGAIFGALVRLAWHIAR